MSNEEVWSLILMLRKETIYLYEKFLGKGKIFYTLKLKVFSNFNMHKDRYFERNGFEKCRCGLGEDMRWNDRCPTCRGSGWILNE